MDSTVLKVALAGLLHDIGKFAQEGMFVSPEFINNHRQLYQPYFNGHFTHEHALYTAAFIDQIEKFLPRQLNKAQWGLADTFINITASHHLPTTPMQWIVAMADRISSGWDREKFEEYNKAIAFQDYKKTRLLPLFEGLLQDNKKQINDYAYRYPLKEISPENIFPLLKTEAEPANNEKAEQEYKHLFDEFLYAMEHLLHRDENIELWFEYFESLMLIFTSAIPAARAGNVVPDVSLYDHSKGTAALATALYVYHRDNNSLSEEAIKNSKLNKFLLVSGDFYGIQDFIFSDSAEERKYRSKILRGRSFAVSLLCELAADMICREIGVPSTSILLNVAGKFTIIAPNTETARKAIAHADRHINDWLIRKTIGVNALGLSMIEVAPTDFTSGKFNKLHDRLSEAMAAKKYGKFDPFEYTGVVEGFLDNFDNSLTPPICPYCGKRPSSPEAELLKADKDAKSMCAMCRDHIFLGENIVKKRRIAIVSKDADIKDDGSKLLEPIFGEYQVAFIDGGLNKLARENQLLKYWDISINAEGKVARDVTARFINGYVPVYSDVDLYDDRILEGKTDEIKKEEMIEAIKEDHPKTFAHLACKAMNPRQDGKRHYTGIQALGILKADVDHLGMLMTCGLKENSFTISRLATLSRQMNYFFAVYLPHLLKTNPAFQNIYTVFAGGDDLFLIGPWNRMLELSEYLRNRFADYVCRNPEVHFSAGISIQKDHTPLAKMAGDAETALKSAKEKDGGRNRITIFGETATWNEFVGLRKIAKTMETWRDEGLVNNSMLFKMNCFIQLADSEKLLLSEKEIHLEDMETLKWRAMFRYNSERNIGKNLKDEEKKAAVKKDFEQTAKWLEEYGGRLKIALWDVIYNNR
jgi:CRISPR-associated protein Csm1